MTARDTGPARDNAAPQLDVGQIWREVDPRSPRFVRVVSVPSSRSCCLRTVIKFGDEWVDAAVGRASTAHPRRFNNKRGGYEFVTEGRWP